MLDKVKLRVLNPYLQLLLPIISVNTLVLLFCNFFLPFLWTEEFAFSHLTTCVNIVKFVAISVFMLLSIMHYISFLSLSCSANRIVA